MKTRIKIHELKNGKKKYVCEYLDEIERWKLVLMPFTIIGVFPFIYYLFIGDWRIMQQRLPDLISIYGKPPTPQYKDAIFDNIYLAKIFIEEYIDDNKRLKSLNDGNTVISNKVLKYP